MEQPGVVAGNFAPSFSLNFLSIFVHISGSIRLITLIWAWLERSFPPAEVEYRWCQFELKVMTSEVEERPRFVMAVYGWHRSQWVNMRICRDGKSKSYLCINLFTLPWKWCHDNAGTSAVNLNICLFLFGKIYFKTDFFIPFWFVCTYRWGFIQFSTDAINKTEFVRTPNWPVYSALVMLYDAEKVRIRILCYSLVKGVVSWHL